MDTITLSNGEVIVANKIVKIGLVGDDTPDTRRRPTSWHFKIHTIDGQYTYVSGRVESEVKRARDNIISKLDLVR